MEEVNNNEAPALPEWLLPDLTVAQGFINAMIRKSDVRTVTRTGMKEEVVDG